MINRGIHQVVVTPGTDRETIEKITAKIEPLQRRIGWGLRTQVVIARALHPLGVHYWVTYNTYDPSTDKLLDMGLTCRFCPLAQ